MKGIRTRSLLYSMVISGLAGVLGWPGPADAAYPLESPVLHFSFNDPGNPGHDDSGNGHDLTIPSVAQAASTGIQDAYISSLTPAANYNDEEYFTIGTSERGGAYRTILSFDLRALPPASTITGAKLELAIADRHQTGDISCEMYRMRVHETHFPTVDWEYFRHENGFHGLWLTPGGDFAVPGDADYVCHKEWMIPAGATSVTIEDSGEDTGLKGLVQDCVDRAEAMDGFFEVMLKLNAAEEGLPESRWVSLRSSEVSEVLERPRLTVEYVMPTLSRGPTPQVLCVPGFVGADPCAPASGCYGNAIHFDSYRPQGSPPNTGESPHGPYVPTSELAYPGPAGFSVAFWAKVELASSSSRSSNRAVVRDYGRNTAFDSTFQLEVAPGAALVSFEVYHDLCAPTRLEAPLVSLGVQSGDWAHFAGVFEPVGNVIRLYADGMLIAHGNLPAPMRTLPPPYLYVNGDWHSTVDGTVDEVLLYDRALSGPEVCTLAYDLANDCNENNVPDECEIISGAAWDGNGNGLLDECESDADGDGVVDYLDLCPGVDDGVFAEQGADAIPTLSAWGAIIMALLLLAGGKVHFGNQRADDDA